MEAKPDRPSDDIDPDGYSPEDIARIRYHFAYMVLPSLFFSSPAQLIDKFRQDFGPMTGAHDIFVSFCLRQVGINPKFEDVEPMQLQKHKLENGHIAQIILFPEPRPFDLQQRTVALAPYMSAFVYKPPKYKEPCCFVVGQKPVSLGPNDHTASVRWISSDGAHGPAGRIREPTIERFVAFLNSQI